jgi:small subunit ribosomal protein S3
MGQKIDPRIFRTSPKLNKGWVSVFYAESDYRRLLIEDLRIRDLVEKKYKLAEISNTFIERPSTKKIVVNIHVKKPGVIIGKSGKDIDSLRRDIGQISNVEVYINVHKVSKPDMDSKIVAQTISEQLEKRISFRKAMKRSIQSAMKQGAKGIRVNCSGRLGGAEIARTEWYREGRVPLHTLRADIDYATDQAYTTYGAIGIKVWIYKGDIDAKKLVNKVDHAKS